MMVLRDEGATHLATLSGWPLPARVGELYQSAALVINNHIEQEAVNASMIILWHLGGRLGGDELIGELVEQEDNGADEITLQVQVANPGQGVNQIATMMARQDPLMMSVTVKWIDSDFVFPEVHRETRVEALMPTVFRELSQHVAGSMNLDISQLYFRHEGNRLPNHTMLCDLTDDAVITLTVLGGGDQEEIRRALGAGAGAPGPLDDDRHRPVARQAVLLPPGPPGDARRGPDGGRVPRVARLRGRVDGH